MILDSKRVKPLLASAKFRPLFIEEMGWDVHHDTMFLPVDGHAFALTAVAHKRGAVAWRCPPAPHAQMPESHLRRKIEREVAKRNREHVIVFTSADEKTHIWQWIKREPGKPDACREHAYRSDQDGSSLIQKLQEIAFSFEEEANLQLTDVTRRLHSGLNVEKVTKKFFELFRKEHAAFLDQIEGIADLEQRQWYASVMLNRLMFVYFIQRKGFLDGDSKYLPNRLAKCRLEHGQDKFYSFYRHFLLELFHNGLGRRERPQALQQLLGKIPYLNGGMFERHKIEVECADIQIPDRAFERLFNMFDQWHWHLDERPQHDDNEINPDVLGYIFEKYINQKQMGAYYTKEDITEYIGKSTIIPFLLDATREKCAIAFDNPGGRTVWDLLQRDPDRYIFEAVKKGVDLPLPAEIQAGIDDIPSRTGWNRPAAEAFALPTEIWREVVARRARCADLREKLKTGQVRDANDLITLNLDLRQFNQDLIEEWDGPDLLRALWRALEKVTVLDPTCGSGAFLFAALNILEPLYEACLDRMKAFVLDAERSGDATRPAKVSDFVRILTRVEKHTNRRYFIFKSIILNNLFGVDIMEEAVEICKLRLFLKLAAQVDPDPAEENMGIEPLPDIDFNIRAGNTLVGYATYDEVKRAVGGALDFDDSMGKIAAKAADLQLTFDDFRRRQTNGDGVVPVEVKAELQGKLDGLDDELDVCLARDYGVKVADPKALAAWKVSHQPFHWFVEFYGILARGGFDVVVGNPPYVSAAKVRGQYSVKNLVTSKATDIYAWVLERTTVLVGNSGRSGMIVPLSLSFSGDFDSCRRLLFACYKSNWYSSFARIPAALFNFDVRVRNVIHLGSKRSASHQNLTTRLHRWFEGARPNLLPSLDYVAFDPKLWAYKIPKINTKALVDGFERMHRASRMGLTGALESRSTKHHLFFKQTAYNWLNFCRQMPPCFDENAQLIAHTKFGEVGFLDAEQATLAMLLLNGKIMLAYWFAIGDDFDVTRWNFAELPVDFGRLDAATRAELCALLPRLELAMIEATQFKLNAGKRVGNFNLARCRAITDVSDRIFARALGIEDAWEDIELYYAQNVKTMFHELD